MFVCSGDCGMFAFKTAEFLAHGLPLTELHQEDMTMYRKKLCMELFRHGAIKAANNCESEVDE